MRESALHQPALPSTGQGGDGEGLGVGEAVEDGLAVRQGEVGEGGGVGEHPVPAKIAAAGPGGEARPQRVRGQVHVQPPGQEAVRHGRVALEPGDRPSCSRPRQPGLELEREDLEKGTSVPCMSE